MTVDYSTLASRLVEIKKILKDYQVGCVQHLMSHDRVIVDAWMGTGKTLMALTAALMSKPEKILVVCSKNALYTWKKEIKKWYPDYADSYTIVSANKKKRPALWERDTLFHVVTYATLQRDIELVLKQGFDICIADECHRGGLRNKKTAGFKVMKILCKDLPKVYMLSGTVISKGPQELWAMLHIMDRKKYSSYWRFVNTFCKVIDGYFGKEIVGAKNSEGLAEMTKANLYRIPKSISDKELPEISRVFVPIKMNPTQAKMYKALSEELILETDKDFILASSPLSLLLRLRQLLCCPAIFDGVSEIGAGIETVLDMIEDQEDSHVVIFMPYRGAIKKFKPYLEGKGFHVNRLWGGLEPDEVEEQIEEFKAKRGLMLCTINFSQSFELETASNCFFIGYDWDQNNNYQAEARLRRLISKSPIFAYYIKHEGTVDEELLEILNHKERTVKETFKHIDQVKGLIGQYNNS